MYCFPPSSDIGTGVPLECRRHTSQYYDLKNLATDLELVLVERK